MVVASGDPFLEDAQTAADTLDIRRPTVITGLNLDADGRGEEREHGWFSNTFKAFEDGTWTAAYKGSFTYLASNKPTDYVDVH
ncbi:hypothetical protein GWI34_13955 [Actinomadura sp. DSM 109109]|nr:hypothetical protein [Actinomadura lepetitiana]